MKKLSLQTIVAFAGAHLRQGDPSLGITGITTDSRLERLGELFLALRGDKFDGHQFVVDSSVRGMAGAIVEKGFVSPVLPRGFALLEVDDTLVAYHRIAAAYRLSLSAKVVAITGSNGKTSTKDFTAAVLTRRYRVLKTEGNFNNHIGVPQTLLRATPTDEMIVLEMGMNHPGEIAPLAAMAQPDIGIITNIGTAHIEFMGSRAGIAREKGMLAEALSSTGHLILSASDDYSVDIAARTSAQVILVGSTDAALHAETIETDLDGSRFTLCIEGERLSVSLPVPGRHMVTNALLAVAVGRVYGIDAVECVAALAETRLTKGRMELKRIRGLQILDDSYNANPDSMVAALETLGRMPTARRRIAVLGKMGELGAASDSGHQMVGEAAAREKIDCLIGVGPEGEMIVRSAREAGLNASFAVPGTEQAAERLHAEAYEGDLILIKGSRSAAMERVLQLFARHDPDMASAGQPTSVSAPSAL